MDKAFRKYVTRHLPLDGFDLNQMDSAGVVVVVPVYLEDNVTDTLDALRNNKKCDKKVAVLLIVNASEKSPVEVIQRQQKTIRELNEYKQRYGGGFIRFYVVEAFNLPQKHFGAGFARKIGMDIAAHHFYQANNPDGIILSLDADTLVDDDYFDAVSRFFKNDKNASGCSIYFEHPTEGTEFDQEVYDAIVQYELHLRYYIEALRFIGFPYAFHTVGSCFAVKADAYAKVGGMNRRQGGEEFYFIQKLIQLGGYGEIKDTVIRPSSRVSDRVPFGTGPSVKKIIACNNEYLTYNPQAFFDLKELFNLVGSYYQISKDEFEQEVLKLSGRLRSFLLNSAFFDELQALNANCSSREVFEKRFYQLFNAFKLVKYINYVHDHFIEKMPVFDAAIELLKYIGQTTDDYFEEKELLDCYRDKQ